MKRILLKLFPEKKLAMTIPYLIGAALFIVMPTILLFVKAFTPLENGDNFSVIKEKNTWKIILKSVYLGLIASAISLTLSFPYAWIIARSKSNIFRLLALSFLISPLLIFSIAKIVALRITLIRMFEYKPLDIRTWWIMVLGMVYMYMPFMIIPLYSVIRGMPKSMIEASNDLGYGTIKTIWKVVLPYCAKAIFASLALVFMLSSTSLVISHTLIRDETQPLIGNVIETLTPGMQIGDKLSNAWGSSLALITIAVIMSIYGIIYLLPHIIKKLKGGNNV